MSVDINPVMNSEKVLGGVIAITTIAARIAGADRPAILVTIPAAVADARSVIGCRLMAATRRSWTPGKGSRSDERVKAKCHRVTGLEQSDSAISDEMET